MSYLSPKKIQETDALVKIKESLLCQLSYSIKEIQLSISQKNEVFLLSEGCNSLLLVIEAIFLHGLKRGLLKRALRTVSGSDETKPQPSFWNMVCSYTHKNTVLSIKKLSQINTDVGRCRAWIRLALNEAELISYMRAMEKDRRPLNSYYSSHAFLRDRETCDTASKFLEGILSVQFDLPINSSILNTWTTESLMMSGFWSPPIKTQLGSAVDVAERLEDDDYDDDTSSIKTSSSLATSSILAIDEAQALKMILEAPLKKITKDSNSSQSTPHSPIEEASERQSPEENKTTEEIDKNIADAQEFIAESLVKKYSMIENHGWTSPSEHLPEQQINNVESEKDVKSEDYSTVLEKAGISPSKRLNYEDRLKEMMEKHSYQDRGSSTASSEESSYSSYTSKLYKIVREIGLKAQKYTCAQCQVSIGLTFGEARLCHFTGEYYCVNCHVNQENVIPSRIIFNWDHKKYPVCCRVSKYLNDICNRLLIDIKAINPKLYSAVSEMRELRMIRIQLNMIRAYLYTCKEPVLVELQKRLTPREYIYEFIDHYTINDLCEASGGALAYQLNSIVTFGRNHVINCWLCSQKAFICEICKNPDVIYPFDLTMIHRCSKCFTIYHNTCLSTSKNCPKCIRMKTRHLNAMTQLNENC